MTAAKNANVSRLLNFRIRVSLKGTVSFHVISCFATSVGFSWIPSWLLSPTLFCHCYKNNWTLVSKNNWKKICSGQNVFKMWVIQISRLMLCPLSLWRNPISYVLWFSFTARNSVITSLGYNICGLIKSLICLRRGHGALFQSFSEA